MKKKKMTLDDLDMMIEGKLSPQQGPQMVDALQQMKAKNRRRPIPRLPRNYDNAV